MYIDGVKGNVSWDRLPTAQWFHLHLAINGSNALSAGFLFMGHFESNLDNTLVGSMKGRLGELYFWDGPLTDIEVFPNHKQDVCACGATAPHVLSDPFNARCSHLGIDVCVWVGGRSVLSRVVFT